MGSAPFPSAMRTSAASGSGAEGWHCRALHAELGALSGSDGLPCVWANGSACAYLCIAAARGVLDIFAVFIFPFAFYGFSIHCWCLRSPSPSSIYPPPLPLCLSALLRVPMSEQGGAQGRRGEECCGSDVRVDKKRKPKRQSENGSHGTAFWPTRAAEMRGFRGMCVRSTYG